MRLRHLLLAAALAGFAGVAWAADGDTFTGASFGGNLGQVNIVGSRYLCDNKDSADNACSEFDIVGEFTGMPDVLIFEIHTSTDCTSTTNVDINSSPTSGGTEHDLADLSSTNTRAVVNVRAALPGRYLNTDLSGMTACATDSFEVLVHAGHIVEVPR